MNHQQEQRRGPSSPGPSPHDRHTGAPGQASRSASLRRPSQPVASGLVAPKPRDATSKHAAKHGAGGAPAPDKSGRGRGADGGTSAVMDLLGAATFDPPAAVEAAIDAAGAQGADVRVKLGSLTRPGTIRVKKADGHYVTADDTPQAVPLSHPLFRDAVGLAPVLRVRIGGAANAVSGYASVESAPGDPQALQKALIEKPEVLGLRGCSIPALALRNSLAAGTLTVDSQQPIPFSLGSWVNGKLRFGLVNSTVTFDAHARVRARGLEDGELTLSRDARGQIKGSAALGIKLGDKLSGKATATYINGAVSVQGQVSYHSEKLKGTLHVIIADAAQAEQMVREQLDPGAMAVPTADDSAATQKGGERAIAAWGDLDFAFTDWFTGSAKVACSPSGHVTVIGKIAPPKRVDLMKDRKGITRTIVPRVGIELTYGIPYLANLHIGIGVELSATAGLGPIYMTDLAVEGVYSTDPAILNRFSITGALHAQADAGLALSVSAYGGLTLAGHSVNAGAVITGKAGVKANADARLTLGYRETAAPAAGKKGEYYLQGHLEMAAQPVLSLTGGLFVELRSPTFSPVPNGRRDWPLGSLEYPIPAQMAIGADVDYVVGSGRWPEVKLTKPAFKPGDFISSMMDRRLPAKTGRNKQTKKGNFRSIAPAHPTSSPPAVQKTTPPEPSAPSGGTVKAHADKQSSRGKQTAPGTKQATGESDAKNVVATRTGDKPDKKKHTRTKTPKTKAAKTKTAKTKTAKTKTPKTKAPKTKTAKTKTAKTKTAKTKAPKTKAPKTSEKKPGDKDKPEKEKAEKDKANQKKLADAVAAIRPKLNRLIEKQPSKTLVRGQLAAWKAQHRLTDLRMDDHGEKVKFIAKVNPEEPVGEAVDPSAATLFEAKKKAQARVFAEIEKRKGSAAKLEEEYKSEREKGRPIELATAEDQAGFAGVFRGQGAGSGVARVGAQGQQVNASFTQINGNAIVVRGIGTSQQILQELRDGARRLKMTETELAKEIVRYGKTGKIDPKIWKDTKLMNVIGRDTFRQNAVEPARIPTHVPDRANSIEIATAKGGKISDLETPADIAPQKGVRQGAVRGHATADEMIRRQQAGEKPLRSGTIRETTGQLVLEVSEKEAAKMAGKLFNDAARLEDMIVKKVLREIFGRKS